MKRILLGASYSAIEPLGLLHLAGLARDEGWEPKIHLVKNHNFTDFFQIVKDFKPDSSRSSIFLNFSSNISNIHDRGFRCVSNMLKYKCAYYYIKRNLFFKIKIMQPDSSIFYQLYSKNI